MTQEERNRLAELAAMAWAARRNEKDWAHWYGSNDKGIASVFASDGLTIVKGKELAEIMDNYINQKPSHKDVANWLHDRYCRTSKGNPLENPTFHFEMPTDDADYLYTIGWTSPIDFNLSRKKKKQINGVACFIAGGVFSVLLAAVFNWIF